MQRRALEQAGCTTVIEREASSVSEEWKHARDLEIAKLRPGDVLVVWKFDRLGRNLLDLVTTIEALLARGVKVRSLTEGLDLSTPMGKFGFQVLAAAAEFERTLIIERTTAALRTKIEAGQVVKGYRLYGFANDGTTHVPDEVVVIREVVRRILADESVHSVVDDLNARGIPSTTGGSWRRYGLRELLRNPRLAGLHSYRGNVLGPGDWAPIISIEERDALLARLPRFRGRGVGGGAPTRYAYSGLLTCAVCQTGKITGNSRGAGYPYYGCGNPKCHKVTIKAELLERDLNIAVLPKLLDPAFVERVAQAAGGDPALTTRLAEDRQLLVRLARQFGEQKFTEEEWLAMREPIERRIRQAEDQQANQPNRALIAVLQSFRQYGHLTVGELEKLEDETGKEIDTPMARWLSWPAEQRRQVLRLIIERGVLKPATGRQTTRGTREMRVSMTFK